MTPQNTLSHDEAGSGTPLVLLHAFPQTRAMWKRQLDDLSRDFHVLCPDLPGFGESRSSSTCTIENMADAIADWLKYLQVPRAIIGGVSMGGYVAMALARRHPDLLRGLILADTRADADSDEARQNRDTMIEFARENGARGVFEKMAPKLFATGAPPKIIEESARIAETVATETIVATLGALRDRPDARPSLAQISVPTLILVGDADAVSPLDAAHEMDAAIPDSVLQLLAGAGHFAHAEAPDEWSQAVREWRRSSSLLP
jgi:pimeloyl-ACP methyl ester carboxylesterase